MKIFARLLVFMLLAVAVLGAGTASAAPIMQADAAGYTVTSYDVNAVIGEDNVYSITETIGVNFSQDKHGIYRDIPVNTTMVRATGNTLVRSSVSDVSVQDYKYSVSHTTNTYGEQVVEIKIGDADYTVTGPQTYKISYKLHFGNDGVQDFDEAYYNIIGAEWATTIDKATFSVTLPKEFDKEKLGFSIGSYGSSGYNPSDLQFNVDGNTITGKVLRQLQPYEAVTMRVELPQGYFKLPDARIPDWIMMGVIVLLAILSVLLFLLFGRDEKPVQTVEFYAPDGMTPAEIGYINDGSVDNRDVVSLLIYWADKGYLSIEDAGGGTFKLHKIKDMDPKAKNFEIHMFTKLFSSGEVVSLDDLKYTFYTTINSTKAMVGDSFSTVERRVFTKASTLLKGLLSFFTAVPVMLTLFVALNRAGESTGVQVLIFTFLLGALILFPVFSVIGTMRTWRGQKASTRVIKLISALFLCFLAVVGYLLYMSTQAYEPLMPWFSAAATVVIGLCAVFISKRTPKGVEWLGKIMGFRDFIVLAERDKLLMMVQQNPSYFYNVLPYAYVLNVTDKWAKSFEKITLEPPNWYYGYSGPFNTMLFMGSLNHSMSAFQSNMTAAPRSSGGGGGGGGFSGGGFSGGGGGGGGGGSW